MIEKLNKAVLEFISAEEAGEPEKLIGYISEGKWDKVKELYYKHPVTHTVPVDSYGSTALHVAIEMDEEDAVRELVNAIVTPGEMQLQQRRPMEGRVLALEMGNSDGDTPLHVAASRGITKMCMWILGKNRERNYLASRKNKHGETPLFLAAINGRHSTFAYLSPLSNNPLTVKFQDLVRKNRDTILHCAISRRYFDLAVIIMHQYDYLGVYKNGNEEYPLKVLANCPSAFKSSTCLSLWERLLYQCIDVQELNPKSAMEAYLEKYNNKGSSDSDGMTYLKNYTVLYNTVIRLPASFSALYEIEKVKKIKQMHQSGAQLFKALMKTPVASAFTGSGGAPTDTEVDAALFFGLQEQGESSELQQSSEQEDHLSPSDTVGKKNDPKADEENIDKKETPFLTAARNGIVEMVNEFLFKNPMVIRDTNSQGDNVLVIAVRSRKPHVVESLRKKLLDKLELWNSLTLAVDNDKNTILHMAAYAPAGGQPWQVSGSALQMMWDANWFQYIKNLVPQDYSFRGNKEGKIPTEIFKEEHEKLREMGGGWLNETATSCSVVAALVAGATFATAATVPGGNYDNGTPHFATDSKFEAFAVASLFGLCFSVTGLIMFLTILTSRKLHRDFLKDLPRKLLFGLSSIFVSIVALLVSFCTGQSFLFGHKYKMVILPIYLATSFPVIFYAVVQLPLYFDLLSTILVKVPRISDEGDSL